MIFRPRNPKSLLLPCGMLLIQAGMASRLDGLEAQYMRLEAEMWPVAKAREQ
jgi:hypothetical protein